MPIDDEPDSWIPLAALTRNVVTYLQPPQAVRSVVCTTQEPQCRDADQTEAPCEYQSRPNSGQNLSQQLQPSQYRHDADKPWHLAQRLHHNTAHGGSSGNGNDRSLSATKGNSWASLLRWARRNPFKGI